MKFFKRFFGFGSLTGEAKRGDVTRERVLGDVRKAMDEQDDLQRANICIALVGLGNPCREHLLGIALDKSLNFVTRRYALKIASGFRDETLFRFIRLNCLAGKNKGQLSRALGDDQESHAQMALFVTGEEILNTPDFFERYVAKIAR
jgi:hypothetical protein